MARILGIETSCDETAASVVRDGRWIESNVVASQVELHRRYRGVVPEAASRAHLSAILPVIQTAMEQAGVTWSDLSAIAVTRGPGLAGALLVGVNVAKALAFARSLPLVGVNHLEGHLYANWLATGEELNGDEPRFPLLCLIVSGGHSELVLARNHGDYQRLGRTLDDAAGEAFDKAARMLGLGYPGGPAIEAAAAAGDPARFPLPRAWLKGSYDFSFSGVKTALMRLVQSLGSDLPGADLAAGFQEAIFDVLATKTAQAAAAFDVAQVALGGGVAANLRLRHRLAEVCGPSLISPPPSLCTDNGAMIAAAAYHRWSAGAHSDLDLEIEPGLRIA